MNAAAKIAIPALAVAALFLGGKKVVVTQIIKQRAEKYIPAIEAASKQYDLPPGVLFKLLETESSYLPEIINGTRKSSAGALGIAQFMPDTAAWLTKLPKDQAIQYVLDPMKAIPLAARYLSMLRKGKGITSWEQAIASYNAGQGNVNKAKKKAVVTGGSWKDYLPQETKNYVAKISQGVGVSLA